MSTFIDEKILVLCCLEGGATALWLRGSPAPRPTEQFWSCRLPENVNWHVRGCFIPKTSRCWHIAHLVSIMRLHQSVLGRLRWLVVFRASLRAQSGERGAPSRQYSYMNELESFLHKNIQVGDSCILHQVFISLLLFVDDLILLAFTPEGLQR